MDLLKLAQQHKDTAYENDEEKDIMYNNLRQLGKSRNAIGAISISEAWMSKDLSSRPAEAEDKQECVVVTLASRHITHMWLLPFNRKNNEICFMEEKEGKGSEIQDNLIGEIFQYNA